MQQALSKLTAGQDAVDSVSQPESAVTGEGSGSKHVVAPELPHAYNRSGDIGGESVLASARAPAVAAPCSSLMFTCVALSTNLHRVCQCQLKLL